MRYKKERVGGDIRKRWLDEIRRKKGVEKIRRNIWLYEMLFKKARVEGDKRRRVLEEMIKKRFLKI